MKTELFELFETGTWKHQHLVTENILKTRWHHGLIMWFPWPSCPQTTGDYVFKGLRHSIDSSNTHSSRTILELHSWLLTLWFVSQCTTLVTPRIKINNWMNRQSFPQQCGKRSSVLSVGRVRRLYEQATLKCDTRIYLGVYLSYVYFCWKISHSTALPVSRKIF